MYRKRGIAMKITKYISLCLLGLFLDNSFLEAHPVHLLNLAELAAAADLIVSGRITTIRQVGVGTVENGAEKVPCRMMVADVSVDQALKGSVSESVLSVHFIETEGEFIGYMPPEVSLHSIFFLKQVDGNYSFVSPVFPQIPAVPGVISGSGPILDRLIHQTTAVIESRDISIGRKQLALFMLEITKGEAATQALKKASDNQDAAVRLSATAKLLLRNDISKIDLAADALLRPAENLDSEVRQNLLAAIAGYVSDPRATPSLIGLMRSDDVLVRRASTSALIRTRSPEAVSALTQALDDKDSEVRFNAIVALAEINQQPEWKPDKDQFQANERPYLEHWRSWAKRR
jgi:hypothetical protein